MLMFSRRIGDRIVIGGTVEVSVAEIRRSGVRLAINAPPGQSVLRGEVFDAIVEANRAAMAAPPIDADALLSQTEPPTEGDAE
jgi:carbon storage regulator